MRRLLLVLLLAACSPSPTSSDGGAVPDLATDMAGTDDPGDPPEGAGNLPVGYYQRQCQWDACGGPMPDHRRPAVDPLRQERN